MCYSIFFNKCKIPIYLAFYFVKNGTKMLCQDYVAEYIIYPNEQAKFI